MLFVRSSLPTGVFFISARVHTHTHRSILRGAPRTLVGVCLGWNKSAELLLVSCCGRTAGVPHLLFTCNYLQKYLPRVASGGLLDVQEATQRHAGVSFLSLEAWSRVAHSQLSRHSFMAPWAKILGVCTLGFLRHGRYDSPNGCFVGGGSFVAALQFAFDFELPGVFCSAEF